MRTHRTEFMVEDMSRAFDVSKSGFYAWIRRGPSRRRHEDETVLGPQIRITFERSRQTYGCMRIGEILKHSGIGTSLRRIRRIMVQNNLVPKKVRRYKRTTISGGQMRIAPDLVKRQFSCQTPNTVWISDITYIWTLEGWLYLAIILDLCSRYVVGWATGDRINDDLVIRALTMAVTQRSPNPGFILHSDQGSQYRSKLFQSILSFHGGRPSMGTSGDCYDNAVCESFNSTLKGECLDHEQLITRDYTTKIIFDFIEFFYNRERIHSTLGYVSPQQFEKSLSV
jgi:putative transposase